MQRWLPGVKTTEVEPHMATYCLFAINHQQQVTHRQYKFQSRQWLSGHVKTVRAMPKQRQKFSSCHDFSVKLSLCICSHTEFVVLSGGAPTPAGTSVFTKHNWDMGMGYL